MYSGIVFDFDGVLYDSEKHWEEVENQYLTRRIPNWNPTNYKYLIGHSLPEAYKYLKKSGLSISEEEYTADYHTMAMELYSDFAKPLQNVNTLLRKLAARRTKVAIASSSRLAWINAALTNSQLPIAISVIATPDDALVAQGKPAPDAYLRAAELLNEQPINLIAIEDSKNGIMAAKAAGLYCLGLRNGFNDAQDLSDADEIINGYTSENITKVMSLII